jgi:hypothetical protein
LGGHLFLNEWVQRAYFIDIVGEYTPGSGKVKDLQDLQVNYTCAVRAARPFAPATIQGEVSLLIFAKTVGTDDSTRLKTLAFLSSQVSQSTSSVMEHVPCLGISGAVVMLVHQ